MLPTIVLLLGLAGAFVCWRVFRSTRPPLPPGPPADPLIGHLRVVPTENQAAIFHDWSQRYGEIIAIEALGRTMVILDSVAVATDLLEKRSAVYSDRPVFTIYNMIGFTPALVLLPYGKQMQKHRKILHANLTPTACLAWRDFQTENARRLSALLVQQCEEYERLFNWFTTALTMKVAYGLDITPENDKYLEIADDSTFMLNNSGPPGGTPVDLFPFLQHFPSWFPGVYYANFARKWRHKVRRFYEVPFEKVQKDLAEGKAQPSMLATELDQLFQTDSATPENIDDIKGAAAQIFIAGSETTSSALLVFLLNMVLHPEVQKRAREELDRVLGRERLPEFSDYDSLPYIECVAQEVLRWYPVAPLGVPHQSTEDDIYKGMFIPKGALVMPNLRGMSQDEAVYANPKEFNPSRFLSKPTGNQEPFFSSAFGFGRRICIGRHLAYNSLWIVVATILATCEISPAVDKDGKDIKIDIAYTTGITSRPKPFACNIRRRPDIF
ncbi:hypothetical protein HGRIS_003509 [Hohenbuehelia grisea]|uniref:Cytochrome P450 n=1 Tax=Hohenbuehelia grisea TaxID=104357 RepID=A0ABR3JFP3_9AGAR